MIGFLLLLLLLLQLLNLCCTFKLHTTRFNTWSLAGEKINESSKLNELERLQKVISRAGIASRRSAEKLILDGRVTVNGKMVKDMGLKVKVRSDVVAVDGKSVRQPEAKKIMWILLHKPRNTLTTTVDEKNRNTVLDLVPQAREQKLLPVGRLERDTTGVMLLTNDNGWIHPLTHPSFSLPKRYQVVVQGIPKEAQLDTIRTQFVTQSGVTVAGSEVQIGDTDRRTNRCMLEVRFSHSQPWALQLMMEHIGCPILSIKRTAMGPLDVRGLRAGDWREMSPTEVTKLKESCVRPKSAAVGIPQGSDGVKTHSSSESLQVPAAPSRRGLPRLKRPGSGHFLRSIGRGAPFFISAVTDAPKTRRTYYERMIKGRRGKSPASSRVSVWGSSSARTKIIPASENKNSYATARVGRVEKTVGTEESSSSTVGRRKIFSKSISSDSPPKPYLAQRVNIIDAEAVQVGTAFTNNSRRQR